MKTKIRKDQLTKEEMEVFKNKNCKLLSSKQLAELLASNRGSNKKAKIKRQIIISIRKIRGKNFLSC